MANTEDSNQDERKEVLTELIGFEFSKLKNTVRDLTINPGFAIDEYCRGERRKYLSPITYFLLVYAISFSLDSVTGVGDFIYQKGFSQGQSIGESWRSGLKKAEADSGEKMPFDEPEIAGVVDVEARAFFQRKEVQLLILIPGLLLSQWLFFRKKRNSFFQNSYFALYTLGHTLLLLMPIMVLFFISENLFYYTYITLGSVFPMAYGIYSGVNFYSTDWRKLVLRNILLYIAASLIASLVSGLLGIIVAAYATLGYVKGS